MAVHVRRSDRRAVDGRRRPACQYRHRDGDRRHRPRYSDDDQAYYFGTTAGISIVKAINAVDPNHPTAQEDANDPDHPVILTDGTVPTFTSRCATPAPTR